MSRLLLLCVLACLLGRDAGAAEYDLLIRNARVIDGSGNPWYLADIGVKSGKIAAIGKLSSASADRTIDAANRVVAPGFIDVHTHVEDLDKLPRADNYLLDGVTSLVTGNCGGSKPDLSVWFAALEKQGIGPNLASLYGHNTVRREVMGDANRPATPEEITKMQALVEKAMLDGAVGLSTGLIYIPGTYSNTEEVVALGKAAAKHGGVYASHMRDEGANVLKAIDEAVTVGKEAGMRVQLSHFKIDNKRLWGASDKSLALVEKYRKEGVDVVVDQYPYDHSSTNLGITLPSWALADGAAAIRERINSPESRARIVTDMKQMVSDKGWKSYEYAIVATFKPDTTYEGKTISEINLMKGRPATVDAEIDTILDMIVAGGAQMVYHSMGNEDVERILRYPNTAIASDGGVQVPGVGMPHPRSYATNSRVLAEFVRRRNVITLEDAIRRMTSLPARTFGFRDRGLVREGLAADLLIFDPAKIEDRATFAKPHQYTEGFDFVLVNGTPIVEDGKLNETRPGKILRSIH
ncbi:MAG: D-aminoacylase [Bryobacteraceae bacterium]